jgi:hypothetical protein
MSLDDMPMPSAAPFMFASLLVLKKDSPLQLATEIKNNVQESLTPPNSGTAKPLSCSIRRPSRNESSLAAQLSSFEMSQ